MLRFVGVSRGRAAEYWGANWTASDINTWSSRIPQFTTELFDQQDPETIRFLEAFAAGFNQYMVDHPEEYAGTQV